MHILIVDDKVPDPHFGAGFPRAYRLLLSLLELGHDVHFFPTVKESYKDLDIDLLKQHGISVHKDVKECPKADVVIMSRPHNVHYYLPVVKEHMPDAKVIYDTEALWYRRYDLQLSITGRLPGWAYRYDEIGLAKQVDLCFVVNDVEKDILEAHGVQKVSKLAHALYLHRDGKPFEERKDFLVVGGMLEDDSSNEDALWTYLEGAWNAVADVTSTTLNVTGVVRAKRLGDHPFKSVNLMGHVSDLVPLYEQQKVFVAMTRFATGIPWKVHEAMAHGIPCLISPLLADQLKIVNDVHALVAATPEEMLDKSVKLYQDKDLWNSVREKGFELIQRDCDVDNFKQIIATNLAALFV